jgi:hypothetical protein
MADNKNQGNSERGFASMDDQKQRDIAAEGGRASHEKGTGHEFTPEETRPADRKGSEASRGGRSEEGNQGGKDSQGGASQRGGTSKQHSEAGRQSHKNS